jgi:hypothetical protein
MNIALMFIRKNLTNQRSGGRRAGSNLSVFCRAVFLFDGCGEVVVFEEYDSGYLDKAGDGVENLNRRLEL